MSNATQDIQRGTKNNGLSDREFGRSIESQAQIADAAILASATDQGEVPNVIGTGAPPDDLRWDKAQTHGLIYVAARTAGDARIVAAGHEGDFLKMASLPGEDVTTRHASGFRDEKAYPIIKVADAVPGLHRGLVEDNAISEGPASCDGAMLR